MFIQISVTPHFFLNTKQSQTIARQDLKDHGQSWTPEGIFRESGED